MNIPVFHADHTLVDGDFSERLVVPLEGSIQGMEDWGHLMPRVKPGLPSWDCCGSICMEHSLDEQKEPLPHHFAKVRHSLGLSFCPVILLVKLSVEPHVQT